jgi:hypothetical protein
MSTKIRIEKDQPQTVALRPADAPDSESAENLASHLYQVPATRWGIWRSVCVRGAGFPIGGILRLSAGDAAKAAEEFLEAFNAKAATQQAATAALLNDWRQTDQASGRALDKAIQQVKKGRIPDASGFTETTAAAIALFKNAAMRWEEANRRFELAYAEAVKRTSEKLREVASDNRFREAVIWQNRQAVCTGLDPLLRQSEDNGARGTKQRQREELVASYLQRYCTKNDTIGFFGPVGWAEIVGHQTALSVRPGPQLLASRKVFFEVWCIDALCEAIAADKRMLEWTAPRRMNYLRLSGRMLYMPGRKANELGEKEATLLRACEGIECARQIAEQLIGMDIGYTSRREVYQHLLKFERDGLIQWKLEVPVELEPEQTLTRVLEAIGNEEVKRQATAKFRLMEEARQAVREAAGDARRLEAALRNLEECFTQVTGGKATRLEGRMYAARTLIYEDCRRDAEVEIGEAVVEEIGRPLSLLLQGARWLTCEVANKWRRLMEQVYREMVERTGEAQVNGAAFWYQVQSALYKEDHDAVEETRKEFQRRWQQILRFEEGERQVTYTYEELRPAVEEAFASAAPGWPFARYHSPDVMIATKDEEAMKRGDYRLVLGELHVGFNTLGWALFLGQHPNPQALLKNVEDDFPEPRLVMVMPKNYNVFINSGRFQRALVSPKDFRLLISTQPSNTPPAQLLSLGEMVVEDRNGLVLRTHDGQLEFDIMEGFADILGMSVIGQFKLFSGAPHTPRISIDRLVIQRENWVRTPAQMGFAFEKQASQRYLEARRWRRAEGMPTHVFAKSPVERKPFYVDFDSPILVDILCKVVRRIADRRGPEAKLGFSEMLPGPDELWLSDAEANRFTSELRMVAVDLNI